uniref:Uncharacterized protein n=1 Tax=Salix viminalis TaxID=40686 RepID=A0A6N2KJ64_SALVM
MTVFGAETFLGIISAGVADSSFGFHCDEAIVQFVAPPSTVVLICDDMHLCYEVHTVPHYCGVN